MNVLRRSKGKEIIWLSSVIKYDYPIPWEYSKAEVKREEGRCQSEIIPVKLIQEATMHAALLRYASNTLLQWLQLSCYTFSISIDAVQLIVVIDMWQKGEEIKN